MVFLLVGVRTLAGAMVDGMEVLVQARGKDLGVGMIYNGQPQNPVIDDRVDTSLFTCQRIRSLLGSSSFKSHLGAGAPTRRSTPIAA